VRRVAAFTPRVRSQLVVLRKAALFVGDAAAAFARDLTLLCRVHRGKPAVGRRSFAVAFHEDLLQRAPV